MATIGELSASIAHELNQPLAAILSNAQAARLLLAAASPPLDEVRKKSWTTSARTIAVPAT